MNLAQLAETGHFTKVFDPTRTIPEPDFDLLVKFLYSIPQSVNAQSSHYIIARNQQARARIAGDSSMRLLCLVTVSLRCPL